MGGGCSMVACISSMTFIIPSHPLTSHPSSPTAIHSAGQYRCIVRHHPTEQRCEEQVSCD